ncbi:hypothetical protein F5Y18DRAFT_254710 [Xylariaceae sp. FL1019]|nr:hypothetical protein F5Y18DRAFT_254710 [Xylariaceae sp. FL1019]
MSVLPDLPANFAAALESIDGEHAEDPRTVAGLDGSNATMPQELAYAQKMSQWLAKRCPDAAPTLQLACRAQHLRRWEIPRSSFPMTRPGYLTWRAKQKTIAAERVKALLSSPSLPSPIPASDIERIAALVRKENLASDTETQVLEDVACLVFLDGQLDDFEKRADIDEEKMLGILRKTWGKMSERGRELALAMDLSERVQILVQKALAG